MKMDHRRYVLSCRFRYLALALLSLIGILAVATAGITFADETELTEEFLSDPTQVALGQDLFKQQCAKCHGKGAYPGKAPKLNVRKLSPEDVYLRVAYGFRRMPAWEDVFSDEEIMAITAYVKSDRFSN
jgi:mono/diheme cytochrome c family protein